MEEWSVLCKPARITRCEEGVRFTLWPAPGKTESNRQWDLEAEGLPLPCPGPQLLFHPEKEVGGPGTEPWNRPCFC